MNFSSLDLKRLAKRESAGNTTLFKEELEINKTSEIGTHVWFQESFFLINIIARGFAIGDFNKRGCNSYHTEGT